MTKFDNEVAIVIGAGSGIGRKAAVEVAGAVSWGCSEGASFVTAGETTADGDHTSC